MRVPQSGNDACVCILGKAKTISKKNKHGLAVGAASVSHKFKVRFELGNL